MPRIKVSERLERIIASDNRQLKKPAFLIPYSDEKKLLREYARMDKELVIQGGVDKRRIRSVPVYPIPDGVIVHYEYDEEEAIKARFWELAKK
ncbi:MAG: hypothetical protein ABI432_04150 [Flavobacteriales bacterium]